MLAWLLLLRLTLLPGLSSRGENASSADTGPPQPPPAVLRRLLAALPLPSAWLANRSPAAAAAAVEGSSAGEARRAAGVRSAAMLCLLKGLRTNSMSWEEGTKAAFWRARLLHSMPCGRQQQQQQQQPKAGSFKGGTASAAPRGAQNNSGANIAQTCVSLT
jgi:hypothetical protein